MDHCRKNGRSVVETGKRSEQNLFSSPTPASRRKPVVATAYDKMTKQKRTVLITGAVFLCNAKISAIFLDAPLTGTELSGNIIANAAVQVSPSYAIDNARITHLLPLMAK